MDSMTAYALIAGAFIVGYVLGRGGASSAERAPAPLDTQALAAVRPILESQGKIAAIKAYREATGAGLRDAKLAVDSIESGPAS